MNKILLGALTCLIFAGCSKSIIIQDPITGSPSYSMFGGVPERKFYVPIDVTDSLKLLWQEDINGSFAPTSVTAFSEYIFVPDLSGRVYSFNLKTGKGAGLVKHKGVVNPAPIIELNKVVFPVAELKENKSTLRIYDFKNGKEAANYEIRGIVLSEIIKLENGVLFVTENGKAMRYSFTAGKQWEYISNSFVHSTPAFSNNLLIFGNDKGEVFAVNSSDGKLIWRNKIGSGFEGGFTISGNRFYAGDISGVLYCGELNTGKVIWNYKSGNKINTTPVTVDDFIYTCNLDGSIYKLLKSEGSVIWQTKTDGILNVTPLAFRNYLLVPDLNQRLFFIESANGKIAKAMKFDSRSKLVPVYYQNILILGADDGKIFAYEFVN